MTDFERKLLNDLRAGHSVEDLTNKFSEVLANASAAYDEEVRAAEEEKKRLEQEALDRAAQLELEEEAELDMVCAVESLLRAKHPEISNEKWDEVLTDDFFTAVQDFVLAIASKSLGNKDNFGSVITTSWDNKDGFKVNFKNLTEPIDSMLRHSTLVDDLRKYLGLDLL